jgi:hypothetical protein
MVVKFECLACGVTVLTTAGPGAGVTCGWCDSRIEVRDEVPFTEDDWLSSNDPFLLLQFARMNVSDRKLWLFCYACARHILDQVRDAMELAEAHVGEKRDWGKKARAATRYLEEVPHFLNGGPEEHRKLDIQQMAQVAWGPNPDDVDEAVVAQYLALLRDIVGNPFRPVAVTPRVLAWNDRAVPKLAQAIHDRRSFAELPVLADALEDAGCTDEDILAHLRGPATRLHARGCWPVDLLLSKE